MPSKPKRKLRWNRLILVIAFFLILAGGGMVTGLFAASLKDMPAWDENTLVPASATRIYDKDGNLITRVGIENRTPVSLSQIPETVQNAFIAIEDRKFYDHRGVSIKGIMRAAWSNISNREIVEGGSTITQQLVKLAYLTPEQTIKRKIQELFLSIKVERHFSKQEILEMYLNRIYLGEGTYGVQAASQKYFNKSIEDITTLNEAATLAALPKAPSTYSPFQNYEASKERRNLILDIMAKHGFADKEDVEKAKAEEIPLQEGNKTSEKYPYPYYMDYVIHQLIEKYGDEKVFKEGLQVYTALDPKIQRVAEKELANAGNYPYSREDKNDIAQPQGAMVIMDPVDGTVRALVGGRNHVNKRGLNRATRPRQPGSAFKPIIAYGPAVELKNMGPASVIDDIPVNFPSFNNFSPNNYDFRYRGLITMRTALTQSVNVAAVKVLMNNVGISNAKKFASKLGINLSPQSSGPAIALGGLHQGVTPLQMAGAYGAFANRGLYHNPTAILKVIDSNNHVLDEYSPSPRQAMQPSTAFLITDMLQSVVRSGTGTAANIGRPAAGKTGTTDASKDIWFAGYTPHYVGIVWIGHDDPAEMPRAYGGTYPATIWRKVMQQVHSGLPSRNFHRPSNIVRFTVDSKSGLLPGPNTPDEHMVTDYFVRESVPTKTDDLHVLAEVCAESGKLPTEYCPERITRVMLDMPYDVPEEVEDSDLRLSDELCELHDPEKLELPEGIDPEDFFKEREEDEEEDNEQTGEEDEQDEDEDEEQEVTGDNEEEDTEEPREETTTQ